MPTWYPDTSTSKPASRYPQGIPYTRGDGSSSLQSTSSPSGSGYGTHLPADSTISAAAAGAPYESATQPGSRKDNYVARRTPWLPFTVDPELGEGSMTYHKVQPSTFHSSCGALITFWADWRCRSHSTLFFQRATILQLDAGPCGASCPDYESRTFLLYLPFPCC